MTEATNEILLGIIPEEQDDGIMMGEHTIHPSQKALSQPEDTNRKIKELLKREGVKEGSGQSGYIINPI